MNTRTRHMLSPETVATLVQAKNGATWREFAERLGYEKSYAATLNKAMHGLPGAMTDHAENVLRVRLGLPPRNLVEVPPCPDCGAAHVGRCYGKPAVQVVVLSKGERVVRQGQPRKRRPTKALRLPPDLWTVLNDERRATGQSWAQYLEGLALNARSWQATQGGNDGR